MPKGREASEATLAREHRALTLRREGRSYDEIAEQFGVTRQRIGQIVQRARRRAVVEVARDIICDELARLDVMWVEAMRQLKLDHVVVQGGKVVEDVVDEGAKLAALDRLLRIQDRRAKLLGLDQPTKIRHEVITTDDLDAQIAELEAEVAKQTQGASPDS